jgi:hypothetical protein
MKISTGILLLLPATVTGGVAVLYAAINCIIPIEFVGPIFAIFALSITLCGLFVSARQWEKGRLGNEVLKEQFKLVTSLLDHMQKHPNAGFLVSDKNGTALKCELRRFSPISNNSIRHKSMQDKFIVKHFPPNDEPQVFMELRSEATRHPLFPHELLESLNKISTEAFFTQSDYAKTWFQDKETPISEQFVICEGATNESLTKRPLRIPFGDNHLRISDLLSVHDEFNAELHAWFAKNHIDKPIIKRR